jgi:hypothetical protein
VRTEKMESYEGKLAVGLPAVENYYKVLLIRLKWMDKNKESLTLTT